jgi:hypothetical protein
VILTGDSTRFIATYTSRKTTIYDCRNDSVLSRTGQKRL